jgi:hypothetical protein
LLPADRVTGIFYRLPVLVQEEPALVCGQRDVPLVLEDAEVVRAW